MKLSIIDKKSLVVKTKKRELIIIPHGVKPRAGDCRIGWVSTARPSRSCVAMWHFFFFGVVFIR